MIYTNDTSADSPKQNAASQQRRPEDPPSYSAPQAYPQTYQHVQTYPQPHSYGVGIVPPESAGRRFIKAFMVAIFIWMLLSLLVRSSISALHGGHRRGGWLGDGYDYDYEIPSGIALHDCIQGGTWTSSDSSGLLPNTTDLSQLPTKMLPQTYKSEASFDLPLSSDTLFFITRGQLGGLLHVTTSKTQAQDSAKVDVVIRYDRPELRELTKACLLSRHQGENGVGVFAPIWRHFPGGRYSVSFEINVILPESSSNTTPLVIKNFETDIPNSAHILDNLDGKYLFDSISLKGSNGIIKANSLTTISKGTIHTSNGAISGTFNSTHDLVLETSNSPIDVSVALQSDKDGSSPTLKARSSNGKVQAAISLLSSAGPGGSFGVSMRTSNAPLSVTFPDSPVDSQLTFTAKTSNDVAAVSLNPAYEGSFHLATSSSYRPTVSRRSGVEDPKGQGRSRQVVYKSADKKESIGDIYWGEEKTTSGSVDVRTSNARVTLEV